MGLDALGAFWVVSGLLAMTPGADWAYAIAAGLRHRSLTPALAGVAGGYLLHTTVAAAGVSAIVAGSPSALTVLSVAGAAYLLWLGVRALTGPAPQLAAADGPATGSSLAEAARGFGVSGSNPKVFVLFLVLLPQFADGGGAWPVGGQILLLGLVHTATCLVVYTAVGSGARRVLRTRPAATAVVVRISGAAMIAIALALLAEHLAGG